MFLCYLYLALIRQISFFRRIFLLLLALRPLFLNFSAHYVILFYLITHPEQLIPDPIDITAPSALPVTINSGAIVKSELISSWFNATIARIFVPVTICSISAARLYSTGVEPSLHCLAIRCATGRQNHTDQNVG